MFIRGERQKFLNTDAIVEIRPKGPDSCVVEMVNGGTHVIEKASFEVAELAAALMPAAPGFVALFVDFDEDPNGTVHRQAVIAWRVDCMGEVIPITPDGPAHFLLLDNGWIRETGGDSIHVQGEAVWLEHLRKERADIARADAARAARRDAPAA